MKTRACQLLKALTDAHGPSGDEDQVREVFHDIAQQTLGNDQLGSVLTTRVGAAAQPRILLAAHLDEVGFMVRAITAAGFLKVVPLGGWWSHVILGQQVRLKTQAGAIHFGVVGAPPPHMLDSSKRDKVIALDEMSVDVGAASAADVRDRLGIGVGDTLVPATRLQRFNHDDMIVAKALDDRVGVAIMLHALELLAQRPHPNTIIAAGTVQEEVGARGAQTAAAQAQPDLAIVLEGTPADDLPGISPDERQAVPGRGVQIRIMDPSAILNRAFTRHAIAVAEHNGIRHQIAVRKSGGTDAQAIQVHNHGVPTIVLGVPCRYIHTFNGVLCLDDYVSTLELLLALLSSLDVATTAGFSAFVPAARP